MLVRSLAAATDKTADRASALVDGLPAVTDCESAAYLDAVTTEVASGDAREQLALALIHRIAGRGKEAAPLIEQVIGSARTARDRTLEAEALALRGRLEVDLGQHGVAIDTLRAAVAAATQAPHVRIDAWIHMSYALDVVGQSEQAGQVIALAKTALRDAPDPAREARLLNIEGVLLARKGRYAEALALHERGRALDESLHGPEAASQVMYLENTTIALRRLDRADEAIGETRRALKIQLTFGEHHPAVGRLRRELGQMLAGRGKFADAYRELDAARSIFTRAFGERHLEVGVTDTAYGVALSREPRHREAVKRLRAALAIREEVEPGSRKSWPLRTNLAAELIEIGELDEAERHLAELLPARIASLGKTHPDVAWNRSQLALVSFERGKHAEAIAGYDASRRIYVERYGPEHSKVALALAYEAEVERARKRFARALELDEESLRIARATASADRVTILPPVLAVAHDRLLLGDSQRALALIEETLPRAKPDDHQLHFLHAWALWDTGKDRVRALALARAARAAIAPLAAEQRVLARLLPEIDAWLAKRPG
jgi:tetratricopeptide (TPR) repeat protein